MWAYLFTGELIFIMGGKVWCCVGLDAVVLGLLVVVSDYVRLAHCYVFEVLVAVVLGLVIVVCCVSASRFV